MCIFIYVSYVFNQYLTKLSLLRCLWEHVTWQASEMVRNQHKSKENEPNLQENGKNSHLLYIVISLL